MSTTEQQLFEKFGKEFPTGYVLCEEGDTGDETFIIQSGSIRVVKRTDQGDKTLAVIPAGEFVGEMATLLNEPRGATLVVEEDAKLLVIDTNTFEAMVKSNGEISYRIIKKLAERIRQTNKQLEMMSFKDANRKIVYSIVNAADKGITQANGSVLIKVSVGDIAGMTGVDLNKVNEIVQKLVGSKLLAPSEEGFLVPDKNKLFKFLEFLAMKEQFGDFS